MPDRFFLNRLRGGQRHLGSPDPGRWNAEGVGRDFLVKYALDIDPGEDSRASTGVPTLFSRPIQFHYALGNPEHPLHRDVRSEWRGLMALFGLQRWIGITLSAREYRVPPLPPPEQRDIETLGRGDARITFLLRSQLPHPSEDWERWWFISGDGALIGATSPWSIVYTAAEYVCTPAIPWQTGAGRLMDPVTWYAPRARGRSWELAFLLRWVESLLEAQRDPASRNWGSPEHLETKAAVVARELAAWKNDLEPFRDPDMAAMEFEPVSMFAEAPYGQVLRSPLVAATASPGSECLLAGSRGDETIVLSETGVDPRRRIHGPAFGDQVDPAQLRARNYGNGSWKTRTGQTIPIPGVIAETTFFPPKLAEIPLTGRALVLGSRSYALPLSSRFFQHFTAEDLTSGRVRLEVQEQGSRIVARLWLPIRGGDMLRVEKIYQRPGDVVERQGIPVPALAIWPDFYSSEWREYYAVCSAGKGPRTDARPRSPETPCLAAPMMADGSVARRIRDDGTQQSLRVWHLEAPPVGFILYENQDPADVSTFDAPPEAGVVLRGGFDEAPRQAGATWDVAVDFGTCNTHVMVQGADGKIVPLPCSARTIHLTEAEVARRNDVWAFFYPSEGMETGLPWSTLLTRRAATFLARKALSHAEGDHDSIPAFVFLLEEAKHIGIYVPDVKWGELEGGDGELNLQHYLRGIVRYIACEAWAQGVTRLLFSWSYPLSLPLPAKRAMTTFWKTLGADLVSSPRLVIWARESVSESEAICRHMARQGIGDVRSDALAIAVDVGGGSSEAAYWSGGSLLDCFSMKLAGNDLLFPFRRNDEFVEGLWALCRRGELMEKFRDDFARRPELMFNALLTQAARPEPHHHPVPVGLFTGHVQHGAPPWREVRSLIYLFFAGFTYYLGLHARRTEPKLPQVELHVGGMGSSLLTWVSTDGERLAEILGWIFTQGFTRDRSVRGDVSVVVRGPAMGSHVSLPLKEEVVRGLLCPPLSSSDEKSGIIGTERVMVGEIGWMDARMRPLNWDDLIAPEDIWSLNPPPNLESSYIAHFLSDIVTEHAEELRLDAAGFRELWIDPAVVQDSLRAGARGGGRIPEPIFAAELRAVMERYGRGAARDERIHSGEAATP